jgi:hypothetical protein
MNNNDFDAFLKRQPPAQVEQPPTDWGKERDEYLSRLDELYNIFRDSLIDYINNGSVSVTYNNTTLQEEHIGSYVAMSMIITFGANSVTIKPAGTLLIGSKGKVDVAGPRRRTKIVLVNGDNDRLAFRMTTHSLGEAPSKDEAQKPINWQWRLLGPKPRLEFIELNKDTVLRLIMSLTESNSKTAPWLDFE